MKKELEEGSEEEEEGMFTLHPCLTKTLPGKPAARMRPRTSPTTWITIKEGLSNNWIHLGQWLPRGTPFDAATQIICGEFCKHCEERAEGHYCRYYNKKDSILDLLA